MREVLIADDHPLFRDALRRAVLRAVPDATLHEADSVASIQGLVDAHPDADLLLLDLHMPGARGFSTLVHIRAQHPGLPIIVVSAHEENVVMRRAIAHGASGYIPKSVSVDTIVGAVQGVLDGDVWLPDTAGTVDAALPPGEAAIAARIAELTPQQFRVLSMIAEGLLNKQIAYDLNVSEATVKAHMTAIMRKLGVSNRTQVALLANHLAVDQDAASELSEAGFQT
ncbi:MAG TPA: response regulator transcription factor [Dokdonella sp.]|uniref:response regulator n=1 Tax=Dokdonella sp. TaxID=2291710 RepID=UPI0025C010B7|nr:response regulator transcription factor [Dokdonella sp.]MBX3691325.1 response regulator transcription factor [Dokdonella sp.]MCW5569099.1 response regulator transcription factor [Dokdonella sp.]HNR90819.1 response regulator transcription factor [Dokdonella sp.]